MKINVNRFLTVKLALLVLPLNPSKEKSRSFSIFDAGMEKLIVANWLIIGIVTDFILYHFNMSFYDSVFDPFKKNAFTSCFYSSNSQHTHDFNDSIIVFSPPSPANDSKFGTT